MRSTISTQRLQIQPGTPVSLDIEVVNTSSVIDGVTATVQGVHPSQVRMNPPVVTLFPESVGEMTLTFDLPTSHPAGDSMMLVRLQSTVDATRAEDHDLWVTVAPVEAAELILRPSLVNGGSSAEVNAEVHNTGNVVTEFAIDAIEPTRALDCDVEPPTVLVAPGETRAVSVVAAGPRPWFSQTVARNLQITATSPTLTLQETARFNQRPRIPRGVITALLLCSIIALWAFIFLFVIGLLRDTGDPMKAVAENWNEGGAKEVALSNVAGSVAGTVTASTTGDPLARVTVEAYRSKSADSTDDPELAASTATGDDGMYSLTPLLPGHYRLRYSAEGYAPMWYPGTADPALAEVLSVEPREPVPGKNMVLIGGAGTLSGKIAPPPGGGAAANAPATITVELVPTTPGQVVPEPQVVESAGDFSVTGLPTPATYSVEVKRDGFDTQTFTVELGGGQSTVIDTAQLQASNGGIEGVVTDGNNVPLGGVTVTLRSGTIEQISTTPTAGSVGGFVISGLEAPRTYVLTFTLDGYSSATIALELKGGETRQGLRATLVGGVGTLRGTVTDSAGNPLGGVTVTVTRGETTATTTTLTSGTGPNGIGTYTVTALPTPGVYTVTFSLDGYSVETQSVGFMSASEQSGVDAQLRTTAGTIRGTISSASGGVVGATVEITDGAAVRTTTTASSPAGAYEFPNVTPGTYSMKISGPGVATRVVLIDVAEGAVVVRNVTVTTS